jgi:hypothetical protein
MYGHLVPCGGGQPIPLAKAKVALRLKSTTPRTSESRAELRFDNGHWEVAVSAGGPAIRINDVACQSGRLMPNDVLTVGRHRYQISYALDEPQACAPTVKQSAPLPPRPAPNPVLGMLIPCAGGAAIPLRKPKIVIGRAPDCDVVIPQKVVSGKHCRLEFIDRFWQLTDLGSHNGTSVDGTPYYQKWVFAGNVLGISTHRYRLDYTEKGQRPSAKDDDVPVLSKRSLMASVGLSAERLNSMVLPKDQDEPVRTRWSLDEE